jgi:hypothetical protein
MSAINENVIVVSERVDTPVLEENKPLTYLPGKHGKFAIYLHWLLKKFSMHAPEGLVQPTSDVLIAITGMHTKDFAGQVAFYEEFFAVENAMGKELREIVRTLNKPVKIVKEKAPPKDKVIKEPKEKVIKVPKEKAPPKDKVIKEPKEKAPPKDKVIKEPKEKAPPKVEHVKVVKEKKPKKQATSEETITNNDIISQIVSRANSIDSNEDLSVLDNSIQVLPITAEEVPLVAEEIVEVKVDITVKESTTVPEKKEKVVKEKVVKEKVVKEKVVKEKVVKEKVAKVVKTVPVEVTLPVEVVNELLMENIPTVADDGDDSDNDSVELQLQLVNVNGIDCYQDENGALYSLDLHPL